MIKILISSIIFFAGIKQANPIILFGLTLNLIYLIGFYDPIIYFTRRFGLFFSVLLGVYTLILWLISITITIIKWCCKKSFFGTFFILYMIVSTGFLVVYMKLLYSCDGQLLGLN